MDDTLAKHIKTISEVNILGYCHYLAGIRVCEELGHDPGPNTFIEHPYLNFSVNSKMSYQRRPGGRKGSLEQLPQMPLDVVFEVSFVRNELGVISFN